MTKKKPDMVNHPPHYTTNISGVECIQISRHETSNVGQAIQYIWRRNYKGDPVENLEKAIWFLQDEVKRLKGEF